MDEKSYIRFEDTLLATEEGRAFLRERDRRRWSASPESWPMLYDRLSALTTRLEAAAETRAPQTGPADDRVRSELQRISDHIQETRREIAALRPVDSGSSRIAAATGELDAIVSATERATSDILNAAERLGDVCPRLREAGKVEIADEIEGHVTDLLMACSFQDITGQRTTKVVNTLRYIEQRVHTMIEIWGLGEGTEEAAAHRKLGDTRADAHLLNGPALRGGMLQDDIDALLAADHTAAGPAASETSSNALEPSSSVAEGSTAMEPANGSVATQADIDALFA
jgi:chemotaxis regulatin CheY-phosphate phosphatase CheZ